MSIQNITFATHNICGLSLTKKSPLATFSRDVKYTTLKSILNKTDFIAFTETKVSGSTDDMKHFSPLGKNLKTVAYSSTGPSDGILCLARNSIETLNIDIIYPGRMVKITCKKRGSEKIFNFFSLYFPANDTALARLLVRKLRSSTASALMENPNSTIILLGDLNLPNLSDPESHDPRSPEAQFMDLVKNLGLNDLARECGDYEATWRGRGERVLTSSILDYAFAPPTLGITSTLHHHVARSDHDVLIFSNSTQNRKNTFSKPSERLFENKKFTDLAKNKLLDASRNFF